MAERVGLLGGRFAIESRPGGGTRVLVEVPVGVAIEEEVASPDESASE
jgi:chemotaxis protein histidine kinase CheA